MIEALASLRKMSLLLCPAGDCHFTMHNLFSMVVAIATYW